jgi:predicted dehydrogenase
MQADQGRVYRAGIIGCGGIGGDRWEQSVLSVPGYLLLPYGHAPTYQRHPRTQLVAAADINPERLAAFGERWGVTALYRDHREMLEREDLDLVSICTPTRVRRDVLLDVAAAGVKGIFSEKPIARTLGEADEMIAACRAARVPVAVNHYRTYDAYFRAARQLIQDGEIGEVRGAMATWQEGFSESGCHLWDLLRYLLGSGPEWVFTHFDDATEMLDRGGDAYLVYPGGVRVHVHMPWSSRVPPALEILGSEGMIRMGYYQAQWWKFVRRGERSITVEWPFPGHNHGFSGMMTALDELIRAVEGGDPPTVTYQEARVALETCVALLQSGERGQPVHLPIADMAYVVESWL